MNTCRKCEIEIEEGRELCPQCEVREMGFGTAEETAEETAGQTTAHLILQDGSKVDIPGEELVLGRTDPLEDIHPDLDLGIHGGYEMGVSRRHARIIREDDSFILEDMGSTNGTVLNQEKMDSGSRKSLHEGDTIYLGKFKAVFHASAEGGSQ